MGVSCVEQFQIGFVCRRALPNCTPNAAAALETAAADADADRGSFGLWPPFVGSQHMLTNRRSRSEVADENLLEANKSDEISHSLLSDRREEQHRCELFDALWKAVGVGFVSALVCLCAVVVLLAHMNLQLRRELALVKRGAFSINPKNTSIACILTQNSKRTSDRPAAKWNPLIQHGNT